MKPTTTINLNGLVFYIDDDAYQTLFTYLNDVRRQIGETVDNEEIMHDVEARIAELFNEMLQHKGIQVINNFMVHQVMDQLGKPEDFAPEESTISSDKMDESSNENGTSNGDGASNINNASNENRPRRRLYLDKDNALLGGVCAGLAAYLGINVVWVRIIFVLCLFLYGAALPIYLLMWIIAPAARTAAQRLEMRGETPSIENIKKEHERMVQYADENQASMKAHHVLRTLLRVLLFFVIACIAFPLAAMLLVLLFVLLYFFIGFVIAFPLGCAPCFSNSSLVLTSPNIAILTSVLLFLVVAIPLFIGIYWGIYYLRKRKNPSKKFWIITLILWLCSGIGLGVVAICGLKHATEHPLIIYRSYNKSIDTTNTVRCAPFHAVVVDGKVNLQIAQADSCTVAIDKDALSAVSTSIKDSVLKISAPYSDHTPTVRVTLPQLDSLAVNGSGTVTTDGIIQLDSLTDMIDDAIDNL